LGNTLSQRQLGKKINTGASVFQFDAGISILSAVLVVGLQSSYHKLLPHSGYAALAQQGGQQVYFQR